MCIGPLRRVCHWGPLIALGIIKSVTFATVSCLSQWWPPHGSWGGTVLFTSFMSCAVLTLYCFLHAMYTGPGTLPLHWQPLEDGNTDGSMDTDKEAMEDCDFD